MVRKRRLWKLEALSIGAPLGNLGGGGARFAGDFEREIKEGFEKGASLSLYGSTVRVTWRKDASNGKSKSYIRHFKERFGN